MKPLHDCGFAGMLPRTMSHETDAFSSKDAATEPKTQSPAEIDDSKQSDEKNSDEKNSDEKSGKASKPSSAKTKAAKSKAARDDEDSDEQDSDDQDSDDQDSDEQDSDRGKKARDDEESDDEESDRKAKPLARSKRRSSSSRSRSRDEDDERLVPPETEEAINVPKMHTVYMLGAMSALTVILWFMAKLTCNIHPDQVRDPKHYSTKDLAADPKNAAYEFHHNFETGDYVTAYDLATGEMKRIVEGKLKECEPAPEDCLKNWRKQQGTIQSSGKLMTQTANHATVELTSERTNVKGPLKSYAFTVEKEGEYWRVSSRREIPTVLDAPVKVPPPAPAAPAQQASAAANPEAPAPAAAVEQPVAPAAEQPAAPVEQPAAPAQ